MIHNLKNVHRDKHTSGFTIVELLIVIVIIGILAAITIVSYTGITQRANVATIQADLANASKKINMYYALYGSYPVSMPINASGNYCPSAPTVDNSYCIKPSGGTFAYSSTAPYTDFALRADNGALAYNATRDQAPALLTTTAITAVAATTGTAQISQVLTAGAVTPGGATVSYQWQSATTAGGAYSNIPGATASTYVVSPNVMGKYVRVAVTGTGVYGNTQTSNATAQVPVDNTNWLTIGNQTWAKANLNVGTMITGATAQTNNATTEKYCYNNTESNCTTYGAYYQWNEAMQYTTTENAQGICPAGAHIPSDNDWKILEMSLGMTQDQADILNIWRGTDQGTKLMIGGASGLNIPLAGSNSINGSLYLSTYSFLWSSSEIDSSSSWRRNLNSGYTTVLRDTTLKTLGFSVRCLGN